MTSGDPAELEQVIINLAVNARDAMPDGGELRIRLDSLELEPGEAPPDPEMNAGRWLLLEISDSGCGIAPSLHDRLFEPFFTTKEPGKGTGLGLSQVYGIVRRHHGCISFESAVDQGTTFALYLPALTESPPAEAEPPLQAVPTGSGQTILAVEDDKHLLQLMAKSLSALGYSVLTAGNGQEALSTFLEHRSTVELVITDLVMPEISGMDLLARMQDEVPDLKVLLVTGHPLSEHERGRLERHGIVLMHKPLSITGLAASVGRLLAARVEIGGDEQ